MSRSNLAAALAYQAKPVKTEKLVPNPNHVRRHAEDDIKTAARLISKDGWTMPILVKPDGKTIIAGHKRWEAAKLLELPDVPVIVAKGWTEEQCRRYAIADNKIVLNGEWDEAALAEELQFLIDAGEDMDLTGFGEDEINELLAQGTEGETDPDDVPDVPLRGVTETSDIWICGNHRVCCGDSTKAEDVGKLLGPVKPHLMATDPPYGVEYDANWRNGSIDDSGKTKGKVGAGSRAVGKVLNDDIADWSEAWVLFPGEVTYVWCASLHIAEVKLSLESAGFVARSLIIWNKGRIAISRGNYHWQHEPCWYAVKKSGKGHWQGDRKQSTVWDIDKPQQSETGHSTQKPVECLRRPIVNNSSPGQAVYDPFGGSGTTMIAAEMEGRHCYMMELNPLYVDVIVQRWQEFTGEEARMDGAGDTYAEVKNHRHRGKTNARGKVKPKGKAA